MNVYEQTSLEEKKTVHVGIKQKNPPHHKTQGITSKEGRDLPIVQLPDDAEQRVSGVAVLLKLSSRRGECLLDVVVNALVQVAAQGVFRQHIRDKVQPDIRPLFQGFGYPLHLRAHVNSY